MYQGARSTGPPDCPHARNAAQRRKVVLYAPVSLLSKRHGAGRIPISRQTHIHALHTRTPPVRYDECATTIDRQCPARPCVGKAGPRKPKPRPGREKRAHGRGETDPTMCMHPPPPTLGQPPPATGQPVHPVSRGTSCHETGGHGRAYPKTREDGPICSLPHPCSEASIA